MHISFLLQWPIYRANTISCTVSQHSYTQSWQSHKRPGSDNTNHAQQDGSYSVYVQTDNSLSSEVKRLCRNIHRLCLCIHWIQSQNVANRPTEWLYSTCSWLWWWTLLWCPLCIKLDILSWAATLRVWPLICGNTPPVLRKWSMNTLRDISFQRKSLCQPSTQSGNKVIALYENKIYPELG